MRKVFLLFLVFPVLLIAQDYKFAPASEWKPYEKKIIKKHPIQNWNIENSRKIENLSPTRFLGRDRFADKFPSWSPYVYANNNPIFYVDPSGDSVEIAGNEKYRQMALTSIQGGLPSELRGAVKLVEVNGKYFIDASALNAMKSDSPEFLALRQIANSEAMSSFEIIENNGSFSALNRISGQEMSLSFTDGIFKGGSGMTLTTGIINSWADRVRPGDRYDLVSNVSGVTQTYVNGAMSMQDMVKFTAHELYGHVRPYFLGQRYTHGTLGDSYDMMVGAIQARALRNYLGN